MADYGYELVNNQKVYLPAPEKELQKALDEMYPGKSYLELERNQRANVKKNIIDGKFVRRGEKRVTKVGKEIQYKEIKDYVNKAYAEGNPTTLPDISNKFFGGKRNDLTIKRILGEEDFINKIDRFNTPIKDKVVDVLNETINDFYTGKRPIIELTPKTLNKEIADKVGLEKIGKRNFNNYLNENHEYQKMQIARDSIQQSFAKQKDLYVKDRLNKITFPEVAGDDIVGKARVGLPRPKEVEDFILRDLRRYATQNKNQGPLFSLVKDSTRYNELKILDKTNNEELTKDLIKKYIKEGDPRFKNYNEMYEGIERIKKQPHGNTTLNNVLKKYGAGVEIGHILGVGTDPLNNLEPQLSYANNAAKSKAISTAADYKKLGLRGPTGGIPELTIDEHLNRFIKFADRKERAAARVLGPVAGAAAIGLATTGETLAGEMKNLGNLEFGDPETWGMKVGQFIEEAPVTSSIAAGSVPLATKTGRSIYGDLGKQILKAAGVALPAVFGPTGALVLNATAFKPEGGWDLSRTPDRLALEAEAAIAPLTVAGTSKAAGQLSRLVEGSPATRHMIERAINLGARAAPALRFARMLSPIGIASLGAEGAYQLYQLGKEQEARIAAMSPEERQNFLSEQETQALMGEAAFATGGRVGFANGPEDPNKILPVDPLLQDQQPQDPGRRDVLKLGAAGAGIMGLAKLGLLKFAPSAVKTGVLTLGHETPSIIKELYATILAKGTKTVENKMIKPSVPKGEPVTTYNYNNYKVTENSEGITISRNIDNGDFGYRQEVFQVRKDPETGKFIFEDITVRPDYEGKLKDI